MRSFEGLMSASLWWLVFFSHQYNNLLSSVPIAHQVVSIHNQILSVL